MQKNTINSIPKNSLPKKLSALYQSPHALRVQGDQSILSRPTVGIVGARKFTPYGREVTQMISSKLSRAGVVIVSGLALGIDSLAHQACLDVGGQTIAVLPSGLNNVVPRSHYQLSRQILSRGGLLISEHEDNFIPNKGSFIERNRLIAGLSDILILTEAATGSGSLHTANFALELGTTIFAVPGNITSPFSEGTNKLIKVGAQPLTDVDEVLELLGVSDRNNTAEYLPESPLEATIINTIKNSPLSAGEIAQQTGENIVNLQTALTSLEIKDVAKIQSGKWYIK